MLCMINLTTTIMTASLSQHISSNITELALGITTITFVGVCTAYFLYRHLSTTHNLPPGPRGLPFIGALPWLSSELHHDFIRFGNEYKSEVVSFYTGNSLTVALNSERVIRDAFAKEEFSGRPADLAAIFNTNDLLFSAPFSQPWRKNKKFMMQTLRKFGFGTPKAEEKIRKQLANLQEVINASESETCSKEQLDDWLSKVTANIIMDIVFASTYDFDDAEMQDLIQTTLDVLSIIVNEGAYIAIFLYVFPNWFTRLLFFRTIRRAIATQERLYNIASKQLEDHRNKLTDTFEQMDFLDAALQKFKCQPDITDKHIIDTVLVLLPDAFEGVSSQIQWCLYFLISHPSNQRRMVEEIKAACGKGLPTLQDKTKLPFCECVILEALRLSTLFTLSAPHLTTADTTLDGYNIPAGSTVFANIYAVHHDPETFSLPREFNPDRFLKESGAINYSSSLIPFCTGRRMCIGEALVKSQVFLAVTQLVFLYHMTSKDTPPSMEETKGIFRKVPDYEIVFTKRID